MKFLLVFLVWLLFSASSALSASMQLSWVAPKTEWSILGYRLGVGEWPGVYNVQIIVGDVLSCTVTELKPGVTYYFAIKAYYIFDDEDGNPVETPWSEEMVYVPEVELVPPVLMPPQISTLLFCAN